MEGNSFRGLMPKYFSQFSEEEYFAPAPNFENDVFLKSVLEEFRIGKLLLYDFFKRGYTKLL